MPVSSKAPEADQLTMAYFVSAHGFGHAARATAVMAAVHRRMPSTRFHIFSMVPQWFFGDSLSGPHTCHPLETDVGLVQRTPLTEDLQETVSRLDAFFPLRPDRIATCCQDLEALNCRLVICDIAALGIAVANELGLPSILVENFTWDWIYAAYPGAPKALKRHAAYQAQLFQQADYHIQAEPVCRPLPCDLNVAPVCRSRTRSRSETRRRLGVAPNTPLVMVTMGGTPASYRFINRLRRESEIAFLLPGISISTASDSEDTLKEDTLKEDTLKEATLKENHIPGGHLPVDNIIPLPARSEFRHPDLIAAADAVVGKVGYSTLAEIYHAGVPFGFVQRPDFPESPPLADYIHSQMRSLEIGPDVFEAGDWLPDVKRLLDLPRKRPAEPNGADPIAAFIQDRLPPK